MKYRHGVIVATPNPALGAAGDAITVTISKDHVEARPRYSQRRADRAFAKDPDRNRMSYVSTTMGAVTITCLHSIPAAQLATPATYQYRGRMAPAPLMTAYKVRR